jgi:hypothetical protein
METKLAIMKKIFLFLVLATTCFSSYAQKKIENSLQFYYGFNENDNKNNIYGIDFSINYKINQQVKYGLGLGLAQSYMLDYKIETDDGSIKLHNDNTLLPVFVTGKFNFNNEKSSPYISFDAGYTFCLNSEKRSGLFARPAIGVNIPVEKGKIFLQAAYRMQHAEYTYSLVSSKVTSYNKTKTDIAHQIELSVGYSF